MGSAGGVERVLSVNWEVALVPDKLLLAAQFLDGKTTLRRSLTRSKFCSENFHSMARTAGWRRDRTSVRDSRRPSGSCCGSKGRVGRESFVDQLMGRRAEAQSASPDESEGSYERIMALESMNALSSSAFESAVSDAAHPTRSHDRRPTSKPQAACPSDGVG